MGRGMDGKRPVANSGATPAPRDVADAATAVLARDHHTPFSTESTAHHSIQRDRALPPLAEGISPFGEFRLPAPGRGRPLRAHKSSMAWLGGLVTILLPPF